MLNGLPSSGEFANCGAPSPTSGRRDGKSVPAYRLPKGEKELRTGVSSLEKRRIIFGNSYKL
jgi:hypothetical protein